MTIVTFLVEVFLLVLFDPLWLRSSLLNTRYVGYLKKWDDSFGQISYNDFVIMIFHNETL